MDFERYEWCELGGDLSGFRESSIFQCEIGFIRDFEFEGVIQQWNLV